MEDVRDEINNFETVQRLRDFGSKADTLEFGEKNNKCVVNS